MDGGGAGRPEQGSRDYRLLPVALALWAACLGMHALFGVWADCTTSEGCPALSPIPAVTAVGVAASAPAAVVRHVATICDRRGIGRIAVIVCVSAALLGAVSTWARDAAAWYDPATAKARDGPGRVEAETHVEGPVAVSSRRDADCQMEARLRSVLDGAVASSSRARVRVHASGTVCTRLHRGGTYRLAGTLSEAEFGVTPLWLTVEAPVGADVGIATGTSAGIVVTREPSWTQRCRERMQESFFAATAGLSDQGRVLVPGLTMGFLGQDHLDMAAMTAAGEDGASRPIDATYAAGLEERFRAAGIMHLMAVSGGHFALVAAAIRRCCARLLVPRHAAACLTAAALAAVAMLMAPGDSVSRALVMGWLSAAALFIGRRPQALSALCVTTIGMLLADPAMAWSFGFALSCAAVLGIILLGRPVARALALLLPDALADAVAMTVAAQMATLPIQVLMEPELPIWSIPANVLVAPVVAFSTIAGLAGLAIAWANVDAASCLAWLASLGTQVMERVAAWLGDGAHATVPWAGGPSGALALAAIEALVVCAAIRLRRRFGPPRGAHALGGEAFTRNPRNRLRIWWADTRQVIDGMDWDDDAVHGSRDRGGRTGPSGRRTTRSGRRATARGRNRRGGSD